MMRITLINPPITLTERYGRDIGDIAGHQAPLGLCYLASYLERSGFYVDLIDAEAERLSNKEIIERIKRSDPDAIGITATTVALHRAQSLAAEIKLFNPDLAIIIGGSHLTANPKQTLSYACFDYGVMHEGEITLVKLLEALERGDSLENIQGIVYKNNGNIVINPCRVYIQNLDSLPIPARHLLPDVKKYTPPLGCYCKTPAISVITSRGCPYSCIFCDKNVFGGNIRFHSPEYVVSEIRRIIESYGAKEISFLDDTFIVDKERARKILSLFNERKIRIKWTCMTRGGNISKDLLRKMKDAGCWQISVGVESGNQKVLNFIKKEINLEQITNTVRWSREIGIEVKGFFMLGHPIDTVETINQTIEFAKLIPFTDIVVTLATPIPGTEFYALASQYGSFSESDWSKFSYWNPVFIPFGLDKEILYSKQRQFYKKFYLRFSIILNHARRIRSFPMFIKYLINILRALFVWVI